MSPGKECPEPPLVTEIVQNNLGSACLITLRARATFTLTKLLLDLRTLL